MVQNCHIWEKTRGKRLFREEKNMAQVNDNSHILWKKCHIYMIFAICWRHMCHIFDIPMTCPQSFLSFPLPYYLPPLSPFVPKIKYDICLKTWSFWKNMINFPNNLTFPISLRYMIYFTNLCKRRQAVLVKFCLYNPQATWTQPYRFPQKIRTVP